MNIKKKGKIIIYILIFFKKCRTVLCYCVEPFLWNIYIYIISSQSDIKITI